MIFEKQEYEEWIRQIADMIGADPDLIKSRIEEYAKMMKDMAEDLDRIMQQARETLMTSEKRKAEIRAWRRYYEARAKASNNYRRMHGLPMVRRPRRRYGRRSKPPDGSGRGTEERNYTNGE